MTIDSLFLSATRNKLRFPSTKGDLVVEQLWDIPLTSKNGFSVNDIAVAVNRELKSLQDESFVDTSVNPRRDELALSLDILKEVIRIRQEEAQQATANAHRAALRRQIREAIASKQQEELTSGSIEELQARLRELDQAPA